MPSDVLHKRVVDLDVTRNRLLETRAGVEIDVVTRSGAQMNAPLLLELAHELPAFHMAMAFLRCFSGTSAITVMS